MAEQDSGGDDRGFARQLATLGHVGMMFPVAIGIGLLGGYYLDRWLGTAPWLLLGGFALGVVTAMRNLIRSAAEMGGSDPPPEGPAD